MSRLISDTAFEDLQKRSDELGDWHATFPGRTPEQVLNLMATQQRQVERLIDERDSDARAKLIEADLAAAQKALADEKKWSEDLAKQCCEMEDALGFKQDQHGPSGEFIPTMGPWKERVRDLIAKEGELVDAQKACAEMRRIIGGLLDMLDNQTLVRNTENDGEQGWALRQLPLVELLRACCAALSLDCGKGFIPVKELEPTIEAWEKVRGFGREDMGHQNMCDLVTETAETEIARLEALKGGEK